MTNRITWFDDRYQAKRGKVAGIHLFSIHYRHGDKPWALTTELAGLRKEQGEFERVEEAKAHAEEVLVSYVEKLGGSFWHPPVAS